MVTSRESVGTAMELKPSRYQRRSRGCRHRQSEGQQIAGRVIVQRSELGNDRQIAEIILTKASIALRLQDRSSQADGGVAVEERFLEAEHLPVDVPVCHVAQRIDTGAGTAIIVVVEEDPILWLRAFVFADAETATGRQENILADLFNLRKGLGLS